VVRALSDPSLAAELKRANVDSPNDLFGLFLLGTKEIQQFVGNGRLNTDDDALIEFEAPKDLIEYATKDARLPFVEGIRGRRLEVTPQYFAGYSFDGPMLADVAYRMVKQGELDDAEAFAKRAAELGGDAQHTLHLIELLREKDSQPSVVATSETKDDARYARVVMEMTSSERNDDSDRDRAALSLFEAEKNLEDVSTGHRFLYAYLCYRRDRDLDAEYLIDKVLKDEPFVEANPPVLYYAGRIYWYRGKTRQGVEYLERFAKTEVKTSTQARGSD
jgi:hypothetical protein